VAVERHLILTLHTVPVSGCTLLDSSTRGDTSSCLTSCAPRSNATWCCTGATRSSGRVYSLMIERDLFGTVRLVRNAARWGAHSREASPSSLRSNAKYR
jgi:hypothetical protein